MYTINKSKFMHTLHLFVDAVIEAQAEANYSNTGISFSVGILRDHEWYKRNIWKDAQDILQVDTWTQEQYHDLRILDRLKECFRIKMGHGKQQNLVTWRDRQHFEQVSAKDKEKAERLIYQIFKGDDEKKVFNDAVEFWGARFPLLSFMFFLKDRSRYCVVRPNHMADKMIILGVETTCLKKCSWENYQEFLQIIYDVQDLLVENFDPETELIDAHSYLWSMWMLKGANDQKEISDESSEILQQDPLETVVVCNGKEGKSKQYYVTRYERNPVLRNAAIQIHGCKCMACGFDFEETYGETGKGFIEVHHIIPLSSRDEEVTVDPTTDMICLCSNCHRMIHRRKNYIMDLAELKEKIQIQKKE